MIPKIQQDESLHSYLHRLLYLNLTGYDSLKVRGALAFNVDSRAKAAASLMGWPGCYGFNRMLHDHSWYPISGIFNNGYDRSYSQRRYGPRANSADFSKKEHAYCPKCVQEDIRELGFSYWRRSHHGDVKVCAKHNVMLVASCLHCGSGFDTRKHGLEIMWSGCSGKHFAEVGLEFNESPTDLKEAKFYSDALNHSYLVPLESAIRVLQRRFRYLKSQSRSFNNDIEGDFRDQRQLIEKLDLLRPGHERSFSFDGKRLINAAIAVYESFDEFVSDVQPNNTDMRPVQSLWATYISGGYESIQYISEDYATGVGIWSCPYPSARSLDRSSRDWTRAQRTLIYPCCTPESLMPTGLRASSKAKMALPNIPLLKRCIDQSLGASASV